MGKSKLASAGVAKGKARGASNFLQIILVLACGAAAIYFMSGKAKQLSHERTPGKKGASVVVKEYGEEPTIMEKLSGVASTNDRITRKDKEELESLIDKVGQ